jgi:hypothetical protein
MCLWLRCDSFADLSTRAGALPKICRQTTKTSELCVVKLGGAYAQLYVAKSAFAFVLSGYKVCASEGGPLNGASGPYAELHFHGPYTQQKYGHRQSLGGDPGLFHCMHTS